MAHADDQARKAADKTKKFPPFAVLTGRPGVGKTTCARLIAEACGLRVVEFNASDTRSQRVLKSFFAGAVQQTIGVSDFFEGDAVFRRALAVRSSNRPVHRKSARLVMLIATLAQQEGLETA